MATESPVRPTHFKLLELHYGTEPLQEQQCGICNAKFFLLMSDEKDACEYEEACGSDEFPNFCPNCGAINIAGKRKVSDGTSQGL
jgi:hypothetical protein